MLAAPNASEGNDHKRRESLLLAVKAVNYANSWCASRNAVLAAARRRQFERLSVRRQPIGLRPGEFASGKRGLIAQTGLQHQSLEGCKPVMIVVRAVVRLAARLCTL